MDRTGRLIGIALAVIALDGCRGSQTTAANAAPAPQRTGTHGIGGGGVGYVGVTRRNPPAEPPRPASRGGFWSGVFGFGESGAHGRGG